MSITVDFIFDFGSPNGYLAYKLLPGITQRTGSTFRIVPVLLGGIFKLAENKPPMMAFQSVKGKLEYEQLEMARFIKKHELFKFKFNPHFPVNTLILMRGVIVAENEDYLDQYLQVGLKAMWEDGKKMDDPEVFVATMNEGGLDGTHILLQTEDEEVKDQLMNNTVAAVERGCFGVPTFYVGDEMFFGKDRLRQVEEEIVAQNNN